MSDYATDPLPAGVMTAVRIAVMMGGPFIIGKGWVSAENLEGITVGLVTIGTAAYGLFRTVKRQKQLKTAENMLGQPVPKV